MSDQATSRAEAVDQEVHLHVFRHFSHRRWLPTTSAYQDHSWYRKQSHHHALAEQRSKPTDRNSLTLRTERDAPSAGNAHNHIVLNWIHRDSRQARSPSSKLI